MSIPIKVCQIIGAAKSGNYSALRETVDYNCKFGGFTMHPCNHTPRCTPPSEAQFIRLFEAIPKLLPILAGEQIQLPTQPRPKIICHRKRLRRKVLPK